VKVVIFHNVKWSNLHKIRNMVRKSGKIEKIFSKIAETTKLKCLFSERRVYWTSRSASGSNLVAKAIYFYYKLRNILY